MQYVGLAVDTVAREVGAATEHRDALAPTALLQAAEDDELVVEDGMGHPSTFAVFGQVLQAGLVHRGVGIAGGGVVQHPDLGPAIEGRVDRIDNSWQLVLVDGDIQAPAGVAGTLDETQQLLQQAVLQPLPGRLWPGLDGQVLVGAEQSVQFGKLARERLAGGHCTIEDHPLPGRLAVVGGDA